MRKRDLRTSQSPKICVTNHTTATRLIPAFRTVCLLFVGIICLLTFVGCSPNPEPLRLPPSPSYVPPDRHAQSRRVVDCLERQHISAAYDDKEDAFELSAPESRSPEEVSRILHLCKEAAGLGKTTKLTVEQAEYLYFKDVQLYNCLVREGIRLPRPPSAKDFLRTVQTSPYIPYSYVHPASAIPALLETCPQPTL